jgi:V/A-type H+-transporting ATPase subunit D
LWLLGRLHSGRLAATLLDRKLSILRAEQQRLRLHASQTEARWYERWRDADRWAARSALMGAAREARLSQPADAAEVTIVWTAAMGVRYPVEARCRFPATSTSDRSPGTAVLVEAHRAFQAATEAAADHAAAHAALTTVDAEVALTRRRLRAINDRWLPRLEASLATLNRDLDESEREQTFRLRWAAGLSGRRARS